MSSSDILDEIWQSYQTTLDCFKVTDRSINKKGHPSLVSLHFVPLGT